MEPVGQHDVRVCGVGEVLWQRLVTVWGIKPPECVTALADVLEMVKLREETTQLRGWLVCTSVFSIIYICMHDCFDVSLTLSHYYISGSSV